MTDMIALRGVSKSFGKTAVLRSLDLTVERGTVFALLGPNGAGKTTVINIRRRARARGSKAQHQPHGPVGRRR